MACHFKKLLENQVVVFEHFFGRITKKKVRNPLRNDKTPGCSFSYKEGTLFLMDSNYTPTAISAYTFCRDYFKCTGTNLYYQIQKEIGIEFFYLHGGKSAPQTKKEILSSLVEIKYTYEEESFNKKDLEFWAQFNIIPPPSIKKLKKVFRNGNIWAMSVKDPIYGYFDSKGLYKIYRPLAPKEDKFRTIRATLEGFEECEENEDLDWVIVTSSYKDSLTLRSLGFQSFALPSENSINILYEKNDLISKRWPNKMIYLNNDSVGIKFSKKINEDLDYEYFNNPSQTPKDPSDWVKLGYSKEELAEKIRKKMRNADRKRGDSFKATDPIGEL